MMTPNVYVRLAIFIVAMLSDMFDGFLARKLGQESKIGAVIDPIFDRLFVVMVFGFFFIRMDISAIFLVMFFMRDVATLVFAALQLIVVSFRKVELKARRLSKFTTVFQFLALFFLLIEYQSFFEVASYIVFGVSLLAIADYTVYVYRRTIA